MEKTKLKSDYQVGFVEGAKWEIRRRGLRNTAAQWKRKRNMGMYTKYLRYMEAHKASVPEVLQLSIYE